MKSWPWLSAATPIDPRLVVSRISLDGITPRMTLRVAGFYAGLLLVVSRDVEDATEPGCFTEFTDAWLIPGFSEELGLVQWVRSIVVACLAHEVDEWMTFDSRPVVEVNHG